MLNFEEHKGCPFKKGLTLKRKMETFLMDHFVYFLVVKGVEIYSL